MSTDQQIEQEIQSKGLTAPRVTPADIESNIVREYFFTAEEAVSGFHENMVSRFLGWKLPKDFAPDAGISFSPSVMSDSPHWPSGTNLLNADQAKEMLYTALGSWPLPDLRYLTFCVLVLKNGFTVTGESACASPENFDAEVGRKVARQNAIDKVWPLMGYALKERLAEKASFRGDQWTPEQLKSIAESAGMVHGMAIGRPTEVSGSAILQAQADAALAASSTFRDRVIAEKSDLDAKISKLQAFLEGDQISTLSFEAAEHLHEQSNAMRIYSQILGKRIAAFGSAG